MNGEHNNQRQMMRRPLQNLIQVTPPSIRRKIIAMYALLLFISVAAWIAAFWTFRNYSLLIGTSFLAYGFGLRHAVDADHIAAIDNVTRKLMQEGKRPVSVGFMFSLGHSSVVILAAAGVASRRQPPTASSIGTARPLCRWPTRAAWEWS